MQSLGEVGVEVVMNHSLVDHGEEAVVVAVGVDAEAVQRPAEEAAVLVGLAAVGDRDGRRLGCGGGIRQRGGGVGG